MLISLVINVTALPPSPLPFTTADKMQLDFSHPSAVQLDRNNIWRIERGRESYSLDIFDSTPPHFGSWVIPGAAEKFPNKPVSFVDLFGKSFIPSLVHGIVFFAQSLLCDNSTE